MPGRIIGVSIDSRGKPALRMAMQTREQHIRRDKATSNICTAQALLANISAFYAVYHGPEGLTRIARRVHGLACASADALRATGYTIKETAIFDTFTVDVSSKGRTAQQIQDWCCSNGVNVRIIDATTVGISFGEAISLEDTQQLLASFGVDKEKFQLAVNGPSSFSIPATLARSTSFLSHPVFNTYRSETQMLRYIKHLENKDLSLNFSMISLGSCTMKLNASVEMFPVTWPEVSNIHPFAPVNQTHGYLEMISSLNADLAKITGFAAVSAQPNSGAQVR